MAPSRAWDTAAETDAAGSHDHDHDRLGDLLWEVSTYVELMGEAELADTPLSLPSNGLLVRVMDEPGVTISEIARRIPKSQQAISQVVSRLEKLGLVERRLGTGRGVGLFVTDEGRRMATDGLAREDAVEDRLRELLGRDGYEALVGQLVDSRRRLRASH